jgi:hypothetical protein
VRVAGASVELLRRALSRLRDRHMADTLDQLLAHLDRHGGTARVVVWEHNSHIGDARATEMADHTEEDRRLYANRDVVLRSGFGLLSASNCSFPACRFSGLSRFGTRSAPLRFDEQREGGHRGTDS